VDTGPSVGEELFSPAALKIIRRHRPDPDDPRYCRACGRPASSCDVVELARAISVQLRPEPARATAPDDRASAPAEATHHRRPRAAEGSAGRAPRVASGSQPQPEAAPI
jgi:hypothetical protein